MKLELLLMYSTRDYRRQDLPRLQLVEHTCSLKCYKFLRAIAISGEASLTFRDAI